MRSFKLSSLSISAYLLTSKVCAAPADANDSNSDVITRDVAIIGGGSAGTYAAISLKDKGKSVLVIEKKDRLGGHTETYLDPATGTPIDLGVQIFHNISVVQNYFARFNLPVNGSSGFFHGQTNYDFRSGAQVNVTSPSTDAIGAALQAYLVQYAKYPGLANGTFLPDPVPAELYEPFGDFVTKYNLSALVPIFYNYNPGVGDILSNPLVEQFRYWGTNFVEDLSVGFLAAQHRNTSELYSLAQAELQAASSVLLNSTVSNATRGEGQAGITLVVHTPQGQKTVRAKKLVIAIPPKLDGYVEPLDLSSTEKTLFSKWIDGGYYSGIVKDSGIADDLEVGNAAADTAYNFPALPAVLSFAPNSQNLPNHHMVTYATQQSSSSAPVTEEQVKSDIITSLKTLQKANPSAFNQTEPELIAFANHAPYILQVKAEDIKDGFYKNLYALQGQRNTYWNGAAWLTEDSSRIWKYWQEIVEPQLLASS